MADLFQQRDPCADPQPGDFWHHGTFGGGAHITVVRRLTRRRSGGQLVTVRIEVPGDKINRPVRAWGLDTFAGMMHRDGRLLLVGGGQ